MWQGKKVLSKDSTKINEKIKNLSQLILIKVRERHLNKISHH